MEPSDLIKALVPSNLAEKVYGDALSGPAREIGKLGTDAMKTVRLVLVPLQALAAFQDRLERMFDRLAQRVPDSRRTSPTPELIGPALQHMKYLDDTSPLWQLFEELIARAIDVEERHGIHPAFVNVISQLSRDEAVILYRLRETTFSVTDVLDLNRSANRFENRRIEESNLPLEDLTLPDRLDLYYSHLESLNLVVWPVERQERINDDLGEQIGIRRWSTLRLTEMGRLFVNACVPEGGFHGVSLDDG